MPSKASSNIKNKSIEENLWDSANKLRGSIEPSEYKHVVLGLIFLKFVSDKFEIRYKELIEKGQKSYLDTVEFYTMQNIFYLPNESRWSYIQKNAKQQDIALKIDTALSLIEKYNQSLRGALPENYFSRIGLDVSKMAALVDTINNIDTTKDQEKDIVGRVYEYFLSKFALKEGKGKGEFYTPKCIVNLITEIIEPFNGKIYDPCCGSGGMFVQSVKFLESHKSSKKHISIYGQEATPTTYKLAKMNLAIRGISGNLGQAHADTFLKDQHPNLKADFIMANPPFNQKDWRGADELLDDQRWRGYDVPATSNANYGWILHMISKLSENGIAGFILANGATSGGAEEYKIRKKMIENDLIEAIITLPRDMFYTTDISVTLWIINKNKNSQKIDRNDISKETRSRKGEILFMDLRRWGSEFEKKFVELTKEDIQKVSAIYHNWKEKNWQETYKNIPEFCYSASFDEILRKDFSLVPSKYISFIDKDTQIDFDSEMKFFQNKFREIIRDEKNSQNELIKAFKELGYNIDE